MLSKGIITNINSDTYQVKIDKYHILCKCRGKFRNNIKPLVGDNVLVNTKDLIIESILDRKNYLDRPGVANIDIALIVTSIVNPDINLLLLDKLISIITINNIEPVIIFSKKDLATKSFLKNIKKLKTYYNKIGIKVFYNTNLFKIKRYLKGKIVTVCGQTGAGKSTFINKLCPTLKLDTNEISKHLGRGIHTTRMTTLYEINSFYIIDTPGFSSIDNNYSLEEIKSSFKEFRDISCKYKDCKHINEQGCKVLDLVNKNIILKSRYDNYIKLIKGIDK